MKKEEMIPDKKIAIISLGYMWFPCEPGPSRFFDIAMKFVQNGYEVEVITSSFQHFKKEPRDIELIEKQNYPFHIVYIDVPLYKKNIDIRRIYSNISAAKNVLKYLRDNTKNYNAVYCSIPANNIAAKVALYCKENEIPLIVDIEDLWPEAMKMIVKQRFIRKLLFYPFIRDAEITYRNADAVIGTSEDYTNRAFKRNKRIIPSETVYVGCDLEIFDKGVRDYSAGIEKSANEFWVTYAGSIGTSYDIKTLILAGKELLDNGYKNIQIKILGTGPLKEELEAFAKKLECNNVEFLGYVPYPKMAAYLSKSEILVNSFVKNAPQSIVNKIGDYLAAGKPMINTLENPIFCNLICQYDVGLNIMPENVQALYDAILDIKSNPEKMVQNAGNARFLAEKEFDRDTSYKKIVGVVEQILQSGKEG